MKFINCAPVVLSSLSGRSQTSGTRCKSSLWTFTVFTLFAGSSAQFTFHLKGVITSTTFWISLSTLDDHLPLIIHLILRFFIHLQSFWILKFHIFHFLFYFWFIWIENLCSMFVLRFRGFLDKNKTESVLLFAKKYGFRE